MTKKYDTSNVFEKAQLLAKVQYDIANGKIVEYGEVKPKRSNDQNSYQHVLFEWVARELGESLETVKQYHYKQIACPEIFKQEHTDRLGNKIIEWKSTRDLDTAETTLAIRMFRDWAFRELGCYLPEPGEEQMIAQMKEHLKYMRIL